MESHPPSLFYLHCLNTFMFYSITALVVISVCVNSQISLVAKSKKHNLS